MISKGLKFIPTPVTDETKIRHQLLQDFEQFARRMHLQYIFHGQNKEPHPFHVKSNWISPVQPSVALESYLESVKEQLAEIKTIKPEYNLSRNKFRAIAELKHTSALNLNKADKGNTTVIMNKTDKIKEAQVLLDNRGVARIFERRGGGGFTVATHQITIRGSPTIYGLYRCFPSCISGLSRIIAA